MSTKNKEEQIEVRMNFQLQEVSMLTLESLFGKGINLWKCVGCFTETPENKKTRFRMLGEPLSYNNVHIIDLDNNITLHREWNVKAKDWNEDIDEIKMTLTEFIPSLPKGMSPILGQYEIVYTSKSRFIFRIPNLLGEGKHVYRVYDQDNILLNKYQELYNS